MRSLVLAILLFSAVLIFSRCEKKDSDPNEFWVVGRSWIDIRDGNSYNTVPIGDQVWMAKNLAYLPSVNNVADGSEDVGKEKAPFYYVYDYDGTDVSAAKATSNYEQYGVLYSWTAAQNACPDGWHLPTDEEWNELEISMGVISSQTSVSGFHGTDQGSKLKATWGWTYYSWKDRYGNGTNETGFTALPGGGRFIDYSNYSLDTYTFERLGSYGFWWSASKESSDEYSGTCIWYRALFYNSDQIYRNKESEKEAYSIRCVKN